MAHWARLAIQHKDCWGANLVSDGHVRDVRFWSGLKVDPHRVLGSMTVRTNREVDLMEFNPYQLEYSRSSEAQLDGRTWQYYAEFVLFEKEDETTVDLLFRSGCLFEPPAIVRGEYELQTVIAPAPENLQRLFRLLKRTGRKYKTLAIREFEPGPRMLFTLEGSGIMTQKQLEAIRIAFKRGFYKYPRRIRISDLAKEAGSARSTFQEHLRLAEIKLITHAFETEDPFSSTPAQEAVERGLGRKVKHASHSSASQTVESILPANAAYTSKNEADI